MNKVIILLKIGIGNIPYNERFALIPVPVENNDDEQNNVLELVTTSNAKCFENSSVRRSSRIRNRNKRLIEEDEL